MQLKVQTTLGKDISGMTAEVIATGDPGAFVALGTEQYHLYQSGANNFFQKHDVSKVPLSEVGVRTQ